MLIFIGLFFVICHSSIYCIQQADPNALSSNSQPAALQTAMQPTQDTQIQPSAQDASLQTASMAAQTTTQQPAMPAPSEVKAEQLAWPDTVMLSENTADTTSVASPEVISIFKQTQGLCSQMNASIGDMLTARKDIYQKFFDVTAVLDEFWQTSRGQVGDLETSIENDQIKNLSAYQGLKDSIEKINKLIQEIQTDKESMRKILDYADADIEQAKSTLVLAQKEALSILQKTPVEGRIIREKLTQNLQAIGDLGKKIKQSLDNEFLNVYQRIQASIKVVTDTLKQLTHDEAELEKSIGDESKQPTDTSSALASKPIAQQADSQQKPSFLYYISHRVGNIIFEAYGILYTTFTTVFNKIQGLGAQARTHIQKLYFGYVRPLIIKDSMTQQQ